MVGLDRALMESGWLRGRRRAFAIHGASAGAFRALTFASEDPLAAYARLIEGYIGQVFTRRDNAQVVAAAYRSMLSQVFTGADVDHALSQQEVALSIATCRGRGWMSTDRPWLQRSALAAAFVVNALAPQRLQHLIERVRFEYIPDVTGDHARALFSQWPERQVPLLKGNVREVLLASGTVPIYMAPVRDPSAAPPGLYLDGGLRDYHVARTCSTAGAGVVLILLHQRRLIPSWFDKPWPFRRPAPDWLQDVLLVHPDDAWVRRLPGGRVPTRDDFLEFVERPAERQARWRAVVDESERLGQRFLEDLSGGAIPRQLESL